MDVTRHRAPSAARRAAAVAVAGIAALGVSSAYASSMSVAASGHLGAGAATVQASCVTGAAKITPVDATKMWDSTENFWVYYDLTVAGDFHTCLPGDKVLIVVFVPGSSPTTVAAEYALSSSDTVANASFIVTLKTATSGKPYLPATAAGVASYGLLVHS